MPTRPSRSCTTRLALPDHLGLWDKFRNRWQTSITCTVRMVNIESDISTAEGPPVQVRDFIVGQPAAGGALMLALLQPGFERVQRHALLGLQCP